MSRQLLTEKHNFINDTVFKIKTSLLTTNRFLKNRFSALKRFKDEGNLVNEEVISFSESDLWNKSDNKENWILTAGKIENLRIAGRKLNGLEVEANEVFSFWKHIGNPNFGKGYVIGREIREGCIIPTIAGGLCQLSNALYDAALKANFEILERHKHTQVIKGSLAEQDRDATVKWNYIDLRFKSNFDFRIEVELSADKLIVSFKSSQKNTLNQSPNFQSKHADKLNDCYSCGNAACFKHPDRTSVKQDRAITTFILDEKWPEFDDHIQSISTKEDFFITPFKKSALIKTDRYSWKAMQSARTVSTNFEGFYRAVKLRFASKNNNVFKLTLALDRKIAMAAANKIPTESTHIVVSQNLLPFLYETGALGGRTFDVLMTRLPFEKLHERLDLAYSVHSDSPTLNDFRAPHHLITLENRALTKARNVITTHSDIVEIFKHKAEKLSWNIPTQLNSTSKGSKILFPASAIGRKGAYEVKQLAAALNLDLVVTGKALEKDNFWEAVKVEKFNGDFSKIGLVLYPTYIEHQPRQILKAISKGIPVITTTACGLDKSQNVTIIELGNYGQLKDAVRELMQIKN